MPILLGPDGKPLGGGDAPKETRPCGRCGALIELTDEMVEQLKKAPAGTHVVHDVCPGQAPVELNYVFRITVTKVTPAQGEDEAEEEVLADASPCVQAVSLKQALEKAPNVLAPFWDNLTKMSAVVDGIHA